jgi:hypothetical protein
MRLGGGGGCGATGTEGAMHGLRLSSRVAALTLGALLVSLHAEAARAQAQALPYSASNISVTAGNPNFSVKVNLLTAPNRPQLRVIATPDAAHPNMTLEVHIDEGDPFDITDDGCANVFFGGDCIDFTNGSPLSWTSNSAPGAVNWVADIWQCVPAPHDQTVTGNPNPQCKVEVTASNFGSAATFNLQIIGETHPPTGTVHKVVNIPSGTTGDQDLPLGRVPFCTDAANFRWIYDAQDDDVVETFNPATQFPLGRCTGLIGDDTDIFGPKYRYDYLGDPSFVGFDCCTWQVDSVDTGTTGSGQALLYLNKSLSSQPPDTDNDGFFDPCDNCVDVPNGPFLGTCVTADGSAVGGPCMSDLQCTGGQFCSMAQEDDDFDLDNGALACPEPGATSLLVAGVLGLIALERRRRR